MIMMLGAAGFEGVLCNSSADICANDDFAKMGSSPSAEYKPAEIPTFHCTPLWFRFQRSARQRRARQYGTAHIPQSRLIVHVRHYTAIDASSVQAYRSILSRMSSILQNCVANTL